MTVYHFSTKSSDNSAFFINYNPVFPQFMHSFRLSLLAVFMLCRSYYNFFLCPVKPCPPEAEGAVGTDIMLAATH